MLDETLKIGLQDATERLKTIPEKFIVLFQRGDFSAELYIPGEVDLQQPHQQDEVYIVAEGSGTFLRGEERVLFTRGRLPLRPRRHSPPLRAIHRRLQNLGLLLRPQRRIIP